MENDVLRRTYSALKMRMSPPMVGHEPFFDEQTKSIFLQKIIDAETYVEYGGGGSSFQATQNAAKVITVESDKRFLNALIAEMAPNILANQWIPCYVDIGFTGTWGNPVDQRPINRNIERWGNYVDRPWTIIRERNWPQPDFLLIDGRFRVACALKARVELNSVPEINILIDDYSVRPWYWVLSNFFHVSKFGRSALLTKKDVDERDLELALNYYKSDIR